MRRPIQIFFILSLLLLWAGKTGFGQSADDYFHGGAQSYLTNNLALARTNVDAGLKLYPDDIKLKKLDELLKQQQQQQQQDQQNQDQQKQQDQKDQQSKNDQSKQNQQKQDKKDQKQPEQKQKPEAEKKKNSSGKEKDQKQQAEARPVQAGQMTPQQAERLLDTQKGSEQVLWFKPDSKPEDANHPVKDW